MVNENHIQQKIKENQRFRTPQRSSSLKLDSSSDHSQSVSFTLKPKCVKFSDTKNDANDGNENDDRKKTITNDNENDDDPIDVAFTVCVKKPTKTLSSSPSSSPSSSSTAENFNKNEHDYQSRIQELSKELTKSKEKIVLLESKNKEFENMVKYQRYSLFILINNRLIFFVHTNHPFAYN